MKKRVLGKTGQEISIVGFGGIVVMNETPDFAAEVVRKAVEERNINYFDVAPSYGNAEERLGPALEPFRERVFMACKTGKRDAEGAAEELHQSLERLRTDHFDLYQLHGVRTMEEVEQIFAAGGALETLIKAREEGLTRFLGFSAHNEEAALALMERFDFDTILFPINWTSWHQSKFGPSVVDAAAEKGMGILAIKAMAKCKWREGEERTWSKTWYHPVDDVEEARMGLRFTLSRPVTAAVSPGHDQFLWWMCDIADAFEPLSDEEEQQVAEYTDGLEPIFPQED